MTPSCSAAITTTTDGGQAVQRRVIKRPEKRKIQTTALRNRPESAQTGKNLHSKIKRSLKNKSEKNGFLIFIILEVIKQKTVSANDRSAVERSRLKHAIRHEHSYTRQYLGPKYAINDNGTTRNLPPSIYLLSLLDWEAGDTVKCIERGLTYRFYLWFYVLNKQVRYTL